VRKEISTMGMRTYEDLRDMLCKELEEIAEKGELSAGGLDVLHKLTDTIKNIDKIAMLQEGGYSKDGDWEAEIRGNYGRGYSREGDRGGQGGYSSRRGQRRDSMGRYSREGRYSRGGDMMEYVDMMMDEAPDERTREMIRDFKEKMSRA